MKRAQFQAEFDSMQADQNQISELESQVESKQNYIQEMNTSIQTLGGDVDRFEYEDWRSVVPDVYQKFKDLESNKATRTIKFGDKRQKSKGQRKDLAQQEESSIQNEHQPDYKSGYTSLNDFEILIKDQDKAKEVKVLYGP